MTKMYARCKCTNCGFVRSRCGLEGDKLTDNSGFMVIKHIMKTGHIMEFSIGKNRALYQLYYTDTDKSIIKRF